MTTEQRKVIAEPAEGGILAMDELGNVKRYATPKALVAAIRRRDAKSTPAGGATFTTIEWRGGLEPPARAFDPAVCRCDEAQRNEALSKHAATRTQAVEPFLPPNDDGEIVCAFCWEPLPCL